MASGGQSRESGRVHEDGPAVMDDDETETEAGCSPLE